MLLFARVEVLGVAWLRIASAAVVFARLAATVATAGGARRRRPAPAARLGAVLAVMNCCFYEAIDRLPLATVAAIEFLPVIALAADRRADCAQRGSRWSCAVAGVYC